MKKLKDVFYDVNDILVALIIVALAALMIANNIDSILAYPSGSSQEIQLSEEETPTDYADNPTISDQGGSDTLGDQGGSDANGGQGATGTDTGAGTGDQGTSGGSTPDQNAAGGTGGGTSGNTGSGKVENYSVYINPGSTGDQIADLMIGVGLFKDRKQFNDAVIAAGKDGKLQAGNFIIPSDATPAEVITIITK